MRLATALAYAGIAAATAVVVAVTVKAETPNNAVVGAPLRLDAGLDIHKPFQLNGASGNTLGPASGVGHGPS